MPNTTVVFVSAPDAEGTVRIVLPTKSQSYIEVLADYLKSEGYTVHHSLVQYSPDRTPRESAAAELLMDAFSEYYNTQTRH